MFYQADKENQSSFPQAAHNMRLVRGGLEGTYAQVVHLSIWEYKG